MEIIRSEYTKEMTEEEVKRMQGKVAGMTQEELKAFRNEKDADSMGFWGKE